MGKIVAIGGGEIHLEETLPIDKFIVDFYHKYQLSINISSKFLKKIF